MKKFVELIQRIHRERFSVVLNKIVSEKIPVAFLSVSPFENAVDMTNNLRENGLNITNLFIINAPPPDAPQLDFAVTPLNEVAKIYPRPEYILTADLLSARVAKKYAPNYKALKLSGSTSDALYNLFLDNLTSLQEVYESLIDEQSRKTFCGYWLGNITHQFSEFVHANTPHYMTEGFIPEPGAIVIDGGTFDGGTAMIFSDMGYKVYGFEMDQVAFDRASKIAAEKNFVVENLGLGSFRHQMRYNPAGRSDTQWNVSGSAVAEVVTLDSYVREKKIPRVDCIKLDVEGAELDVLKGAAVTIARWKPILLLSAYHKWDDFWTLMNFVKSVRSDYEWALRHYPAAHEDAPSVMELSADEIAFNLGLDANQKRENECCLLAR